MSEIKHSEGPWGTSSESPRIIKQYDSLGETNVIIGSASAYPKGGFFPSDEVALANARLICAAPDLLEALDMMVKRIEFYSSLKDGERPNIEQWEYTEGSSEMDKARAAITKATWSKS